jgi:hypothetical protein
MGLRECFIEDHRGIRSKKLKGKSKKIPEEILFTLNFYLFT